MNGENGENVANDGSGDSGDFGDFGDFGGCAREAVDAANWPYPVRIAHRGAGLLAPENTMAAMRVGASYGYRMFEFDVKLSADGEPFLLHDATLDRTTDGGGPASLMTMAELERLDAGGWHGSASQGERLPRFIELAGWLRDNDLLANVEIKPSPGRDAETGAVVAAAAERLWAGRRLPPLLSSFSEVALEAAMRAAPLLPRALLVERVPEDWAERLRRLGCVALDANHRALTATRVAQVKDAGFRVLAYTVNHPSRARMLEDWGVDGIITDAVDRIAPVRLPDGLQRPGAPPARGAISAG